VNKDDHNAECHCRARPNVNEKELKSKYLLCDKKVWTKVLKVREYSIRQQLRLLSLPWKGFLNK